MLFRSEEFYVRQSHSASAETICLILPMAAKFMKTNVHAFSRAHKMEEGTVWKCEMAIETTRKQHAHA